MSQSARVKIPSLTSQKRFQAMMEKHLQAWSGVTAAGTASVSEERHLRGFHERWRMEDTGFAFRVFIGGAKQQEHSSMGMLGLADILRAS